MKNFISKFLSDVFSPLIVIVKLIYQFINSLIKVIFEIPVKMISTITNRFDNKTDDLNDKLDNIEQQSQQNKEIKKTQSTIKSLFRLESFMGHPKTSSVLRLVLILFLQLASFFTTYRGFDQFFSAFGSYIPLMLALVIQVGLYWFSSTANNIYAPKTQKILLAVSLLISIFFSYAGASEVPAPYKNYVRNLYLDFMGAYSDICFETTIDNVSYSDPSALIKAEYQKINHILSIAELEFNEETLNSAEKKLNEYENMTTVVFKDNPTQLIYDPNTKSWITYGGGNEPVEVIDPNAKPLIQKQEEYIEKIKKIMNQCDNVRNLLKEFELNHILTVVKKKMENDMTIEQEFWELSSSISSLVESTNNLAELVSNIKISIDLNALISEYQKYATAISFEKIKNFGTIITEWHENTEESNKFTTFNTESKNNDNNDNDDNNNNIILQDIFENLTVNNPSKLKDLVYDYVADIYFSFHTTLKASDLDVQTEKIENLNTAYHNLENMYTPLIYSYSLFLSRDTITIALFILIIAIFIDGYSVLLGVCMSHKRPNWLTKNKLNKNAIAPYAYSQFKMIMMTIINSKLDKIDTQSVYMEFIGILQEYLDKFQTSPGLYKAGFSGYIPFDQSIDGNFKLFINFCINFGIAKIMSGEELNQYGFHIDDDMQFILLTANGELWLTDLIGNAADICIDMKCKSDV